MSERLGLRHRKQSFRAIVPLVIRLREGKQAARLERHPVPLQESVFHWPASAASGSSDEMPRYLRTTRGGNDFSHRAGWTLTDRKRGTAPVLARLSQKSEAFLHIEELEEEAESTMEVAPFGRRRYQSTPRHPRIHVDSSSQFFGQSDSGLA